MVAFGDLVGAGEVLEGGGHEAFGVEFALGMEVVCDGAGGCLGHGCEVVEAGDVLLYLFVVVEVPEVEFFEDIVDGEEAMTILLDDIGLSLLDVFTDIPDMDWVAVPSYQPHLIDININPTNSQK